MKWHKMYMDSDTELAGPPQTVAVMLQREIGQDGVYVGPRACTSPEARAGVSRQREWLENIFGGPLL